jgi:membrane protein
MPKVVRIAVGILLVLSGLVGFLPVLGFWMVPLGLFVLTFDLPWLRPYYRRLRVWAWKFVARLRRTAAWRIGLRAWEGFSEDRVPSMSAAIAFYTLFSMAPTLLLVSWVAGLYFGHDASQRALAEELGSLIGKSEAEAIRELTSRAGSGVAEWSIVETVLGAGLLIFGATTVFVEINAALNVIWRKEDTVPGGVWDLLRSRALSLSLVLSMGFLLLVSLVLNAGVSAVMQYAAGIHELIVALVQVVNFALSFVMTFILFALMYKLLPTVAVMWREVWLAALTAAAFFNIGKSAIGLYIGQSDLASTYGAASAIIVILLWVYYSVLIFLAGAEISKAYASYGEARGR